MGHELGEQGMLLEGWIRLHDGARREACFLDELRIRERGHGEVRHAGLLDAEELARTAELEVRFGQREPVIGLRQRFQPPPRCRIVRRGKEAVGLLGTAADAAMTMRVAFGTSTPTSMTAVDTRTSWLPPLNSRIVRSFWRAGIRPCSMATRRSGNARASVALTSPSLEIGRSPCDGVNTTSIGVQ